MPSSARNKTLLRRLQRKHTEKAYRHMKDKLLSILKPMPTAVHANNLEEFRQSLFANKRDDDMPSRVESTVDGTTSTPAQDCNRCAWCGIWMPLPINRIIVTTDVLDASSTSEPVPDPLLCQLAEVDLAVDALLDVCLCQAPCALVHEQLVQVTANMDLDVGESIWDRTGSFLAAEAPSSKEVRLVDNSFGSNKYCFKRTHASAEVPEAVPNENNTSSSFYWPPPSHHRYATDESSGECKTQ